MSPSPAVLGGHALAVSASLEPPSAMSGGASDGPGTFAPHGTERINSALPLLLGFSFLSSSRDREHSEKETPALLSESRSWSFLRFRAFIGDFVLTTEHSARALMLSPFDLPAIIHISRSLSSISSTEELGCRNRGYRLKIWMQTRSTVQPRKLGTKRFKGMRHVPFWPVSSTAVIQNLVAMVAKADITATSRGVAV